MSREDLLKVDGVVTESLSGSRFSVKLADGRIIFEAQFAGRSRVVAARPGEQWLPLVETSEETFVPAAVINDEQIACLIGRSPRQTVALVSTKNGQIISRLKATEGKAIAALAASPDGKRLYFVESQTVWVLSIPDGEPRRISAGDGVAPSRDGRYLIVQLNDKNRVVLTKVAIDGSNPQPISLKLDNLELSSMALSPNAVAPDGRIVLSVTSPPSWFQSAAIMDPGTGRLERVPTKFSGDIHYPSWTKDGRIIAAGFPMRSSIWRFRPEN